MSIGRRHPLHDVNLFFDPCGERDGRSVQFSFMLNLLLCIDRAAVKRRDIINNKRNKGNKRKWYVSILPTVEDKLG